MNFLYINLWLTGRTAQLHSFRFPEYRDLMLVLVLLNRKGNNSLAMPPVLRFCPERRTFAIAHILALNSISYGYKYWNSVKNNNYK